MASSSNIAEPVPVLVSREMVSIPIPTSETHLKASSVTGSRDTVEGLSISEGSASPVSSRKHHTGSQSTSDELLGDGESIDGRLRSSSLRDKKGFFSPRRAGALLNIFSASHRHKNSELHKIFTSLPESELLIDDYSCALQRDILIHGRLYLTQRWICFYANIFSWETLLTIPFQSVQAITKEKTALVIPNAIQLSTTTDKYGFSSLGNRDMTYNIIFKCWQNVLLNQAISPLGLVQAARKARGESTDVGSGEELWGKTTEGGQQVPQSMSLPTHLEIGLLPPTTLPLEEAQQRSEVDGITETSSDSVQSRETGSGYVSAIGILPTQTSVPSSLGATSEAKATSIRTTESKVSPTVEVVNFNTPPATVDYNEKISVGGESIASSEYETVSLIEDTGEIVCGCSEHLGRTIINDLYDCDVETIFQLIFTDTEFIRNFFKGEKQFNIVMGDWHSNTDGSRLRDLTYTIALNYSFGPKFCHTTEHQVYSKMGQPGLKHIVDTEVINHNIPYSDTFYVACRYCITRVAPKKSRLKITANIKFKKSCWGLVKHLIERNAGDGVRAHYSHLDVALKEHIATLPEKYKRGRHHGHGHSHRRSRHKRPTPPVKSNAGTPQPSIMEEQERIFPPTRTESTLRNPDVAAVTVSSNSTTNKKEGSLSRINLALTLLLGILVASNVLLYQQLMGYNVAPPIATPIITPLPDITNKLYQSHIPGQWPSSQEQWMSLVRELVEKRDKEVLRWQQTVSGLTKQLEQVEASMASAKTYLLAHLEDYKDRDDFTNMFPSGDKEVPKNTKPLATGDNSRQSRDKTMTTVFDSSSGEHKEL